MSVIFQTLQKMRHPSGGPDEKERPQRRRANVYTFRRMLLSAPGILGLMVVIALSALALFYLFEALNSGPGPRSPTKEHPQAAPIVSGTAPSETPQAQGQSTQGDGSGVIPSPPAQIPVEEVEIGKLYLPQSRRPVLHSSAGGVARYLPPLSKPSTDPAGGAEKASGAVQMSSPFNSAHILKASVSTHGIAVAGATEKARESLRERHPEREFSNAGIRPSRSVPEALPKPEPEEFGEEERLRLAKAEESAKISRLVSALEQAVSTENAPRVEHLIRELVTLKGKEDDYVTRVRAYWHLKRGDFDRAAELLNRLLQKDGNDRVAGINMAVLEIKTGRLEDARRRLRKLKQLFQEDPVIPSLLQKIGM